jgi:hypothetical protein
MTVEEECVSSTETMTHIRSERSFFFPAPWDASHFNIHWKESDSIERERTDGSKRNGGKRQERRERTR